MNAKYDPLTNFDVSLMKQRTWDSDKQKLLEEIQRLRNRFALVQEILSVELPTHWPVITEVYRIAEEEVKRQGAK